MKIKILLFGILKELVGRGAETLDLADGTRVRDVLAHYSTEVDRFKGLAPSLAIAVNQEYAGWRESLSAGDEVAFLPPVSGGEHVATVEDIFQLVREPIRSQELVESIKAPEDGAAVVFDGFVRNNFRGKRTLYLEYEAYEAMALAKMREIGSQMREKFQIHRIIIVHRLGRLEIGETSVWIAVSSAHRAAAFDACRYAIDTLKRTVPIWKKEYFAGGAVWAEGEIAGEIASQEAISRADESTS